MRPTKYFRNSTDMTAFAQFFGNQHKDHWFIRTTLRCDHVINENRKAIVLVNNETIVQRLITCKVCNTHGNSYENDLLLKSLNVEPKKNENQDGVSNI